MSSTPLTLAALATSAVPGLQVVGAREHTLDGEGAFSSAVLLTEDAELIVRVPRISSAEVRQSAEMLGQAALADGARSALPFQAPETLGITRAGETRAVVSTFLPGGRIVAADLASDALLLQPIAETLAAIHRLPLSLVKSAGLPVRETEDVRQAAARLVERAAATRLLPGTVHGRWLDALASHRLWDFAPNVVHGSLDADHLLVADEQVVGVLGWDELSVGDPAVDLAWLLEAGPEVLDSVLARYMQQRGTGGGAELRARAQFHHELGVARWLLHGVETHDDAVVEDAIAMLDRLVDRLTGMSDPAPSRTIASADEVERLLDDMPDPPEDLRSETAEHESLDEDRMFSSDGDFADEEPQDRAPAGEEGLPGVGDSGGSGIDPDDGAAVDLPAGSPSDGDEDGLESTQPLDALELLEAIGLGDESDADPRDAPARQGEENGHGSGSASGS